MKNASATRRQLAVRQGLAGIGSMIVLPRRFLLLATAAGLGLVVAACGGGTTSTSSVKRSGNPPRTSTSQSVPSTANHASSAVPSQTPTNTNTALAAPESPLGESFCSRYDQVVQMLSPGSDFRASGSHTFGGAVLQAFTTALLNGVAPDPALSGYTCQWHPEGSDAVANANVSVQITVFLLSRPLSVEDGRTMLTSPSNAPQQASGIGDWAFNQNSTTGPFLTIGMGGRVISLAGPGDATFDTMDAAGRVSCLRGRIASNE